MYNKRIPFLKKWAYKSLIHNNLSEKTAGTMVVHPNSYWHNLGLHYCSVMCEYAVLALYGRQISKDAVKYVLEF